MENANIDNAELLKKIMPEEAMNKVFEQQAAEKELQKIKEKEIETKYSKGFEFDVQGKSIELFLKKKVTPESRHKLRNIVRDFPKNKHFIAIDTVKLKFPELKDDYGKLFAKILIEFPELTEQGLLNYLRGVPDENYESDMEIFFMKYFQNILSMDNNSKLLIETPVVIENKLNDLWNTIDYEEVVTAVGFFRKKVGI